MTPSSFQALLALRFQPLGMEILSAAQAIFQVSNASARIYESIICHEVYRDCVFCFLTFSFFLLTEHSG